MATRSPPAASRTSAAYSAFTPASCTHQLYGSRRSGTRRDRVRSLAVAYGRLSVAALDQRCAAMAIGDKDAGACRDSGSGGNDFAVRRPEWVKATINASGSHSTTVVTTIASSASLKQ